MSISTNMIFIWFLLFTSLSYKFLNKNSHLMILLMTLEIFMLLNLWSMTFLFIGHQTNLMFMMIFFALSVSEACLGLSILVFISRTYGEEMKKNF